MKGTEEEGFVSWHDEDDASACWQCGKRLDGASAKNHDHPPQHLDTSVCIYCGAISIFTGKGLEVRAPTDEERQEREVDPDIMLARVMVEMINKRPREGQNRARGSRRT